jgi:hypothetical protein
MKIGAINGLLDNEAVRRAVKGWHLGIGGLLE